MKPPNPPKKPVKPKAPSPLITKVKQVILEEWDEKPLSEVLELEFPGVSLYDIKVFNDYDLWEDGVAITLVKRDVIQDPKYDEKMTNYHKKLEEYEEARRQYKLDVEEYKQKLKLWHEEQLKDLTD
jgi:hypothetical protein